MGRKRKLVYLLMLVAIVTSLLLKSSLWTIPNSGEVYFTNTMNSTQNFNESFKTFSAYLESVQNSIISRLEKLENTNADYIIYDCSTYMQKGCGGWNDRITGVVNTLMLSLVTNKRFRLIINKPCEIKAYFIPSKINWTVKPDIMSSKNMSKLMFTNGVIMRLDRKNVSRNFPSYVNLFRNNWDATDLWRVTPNIKEKIPWICNVHHADIYKLIFEALFKPSDSIRHPISALQLKKSKKLVCAHVRIGYNEKNKRKYPSENRFPFKSINIIFDFLKKFDPRTHYVYIATDSPKVKELSNKTFNKNFIDIPGKIMHLEYDQGKDECEGYAQSLREWWILTKCDMLVLTQSGFGMMAAYLLDNNKPLYCANAEKLVPCNRYNVVEHFPLEMHIPKYIPISQRDNKTRDYCPPGELQLTKNLPWYLKPLVN